VKIHPTAVVHPETEIGEDVEIGPYVCIEGRADIGQGTVIYAHAILSGTVRIGKGNTIGHGAIIGAYPQDLSFKPQTRSEVRIGDGNVIRELSTIHRGTGEGTATVVGNDNFLMAGTHLAHNVQIGNNVIIANNSLLGGHVQIGDRAFLGGGSVYHQHVRIGLLALTQGLSAFSQDLPPYVIGAERNWVAGLNIVGMRRAGFSAELRKEVKTAFQLLYKSGLNLREAVEKADEINWSPEVRLFFDFVKEAKKRGLVTWFGTRHGSARHDRTKDGGAED